MQEIKAKAIEASRLELEIEFRCSAEMEYPNSFPVRSLVCAIVFSFFLFGCTSTRSQRELNLAGLYQGMPNAELLEMIGEPDARKPYENEAGFEIWVYERSSEAVEMVVVGSVETDYVNWEGYQSTVSVPVYEPDVTRTESRVEFLVSDKGAVVAWKVLQEEKRLPASG